jgi:D-glycero-D-manno-heptose 1,7-bisphosphate phosphatase
VLSMPRPRVFRRVPVLYLDLDGTVRWGKDELGHFGRSVEDVRVFPEVPPLLARYKELGWRIIAVSNQGGVALGHLTKDECAAMMMETHKQSGAAFDKVMWCAHHPDAKDPEMAVCWCRKPRPGLIILGAHALVAQYPLEMYPPHLGLMVGDREEDKGAAENAGLPFMDAVAWRFGAHLQTLEN